MLGPWAYRDPCDQQGPMHLTRSSWFRGRSRSLLNAHGVLVQDWGHVTGHGTWKEVM